MLEKKVFHWVLIMKFSLLICTICQNNIKKISKVASALQVLILCRTERGRHFWALKSIPNWKISSIIPDYLKRETWKRLRLFMKLNNFLDRTVQNFLDSAETQKTNHRRVWDDTYLNRRHICVQIPSKDHLAFFIYCRFCGALSLL